jgi:dipeptidyl aminopeptidase/acylaminoacyl peptidase
MIRAIRKIVGALLLVAADAAAEPPPLRAFDIDDVNRVAEVSAPVFAPDDSAIFYTIGTANAAIDAATSDIWRASVSGAAARNLTRSPKSSESKPALSPDGARLYFLSDRTKDETTQVFVSAATGGRARQITRFDQDVEDYALSPDGARLAVVVETGGPEANDAETPPPIVIEGYVFKEDGRGYVGAARRQLFLVGARTGEATQLTRGQSDVDLPSWSPDGAHIAYVARAGDEPDRTMNYDIFIVEAREGAEPRQATRSPLADGDPNYGGPPQWSPDGATIAYLRTDWPKHGPYALSEIALVDVATGAERALPAHDHWHYPPKWSADGKSLLAPVETTHAQRLARIDAATGAVDFLSGESATVYDVAVSKEGAIAALMGDSGRPNEIFFFEGAGLRRLTDHNAWIGERRAADIRDIAFKSKDGTEIKGVLMTPPGRPDGALPMVVAVHGGPVWQWQHEFDARWQVYAARGYAVLGVNPRGSSGRGQAFSKALWRDWGGKEVEDVLAGVDYAVAQGIADPKRLAVIGWSWGGILANYLIASDTRFKAAVSGAGMANFFAAYGTDQYPVYYDVEIGAPFENEALWRKLSYPFFEAAKIKTPTQYQCAEADFNVPCIGAEQMYAALKRVGTPTELIVFPGENHGLATPSYLEERLRLDLAWIERWLGANAPPDTPSR